MPNGPRAAATTPAGISASEAAIVRRLGENCGICWHALHRFATDHGFEHAGNLAFLGTLALFPFLIFLLANLPADIAATLAGPIDTVVSSSGDGG